MRKKLFPFSMFLFFGVLNTIVNALLIEISGKFGVETYQIGYVMTLVNIINSVIIYYNGMILDKINVKREAILGIGITMLGIVCIAFSNTLLLFTLSYVLYAVGFGILFSLGNYLGLVLFEEKERASIYNYLTFTFCIGAFVTPYLSAFLLQKGLRWEEIYLLTLIILVGAFLLIFNQRLNIVAERQKTEVKGRIKWTRKIYFSALAIFFYGVSEIILGMWMVTYIQEIIGFDKPFATLIYSVFWLFMGVGRFLAGVLLRKISSKNYIIIFSICAIFACVGFLNVYTKVLLLVFVSIVGFCYAGLYPTIVSFGSQGKEVPTARAMSFILTFATIGNVATNPISSAMVQFAGMKSALYVGVGFMVLVVIAILCAKNSPSANNIEVNSL